MPSLHPNAKLVFSVPHVWKNIWNSDLFPASAAVVPGGFVKGEDISEFDTLAGVHTDSLCGAAADMNRAVDHDFLTTSESWSGAPGWWLDLICFIDQPGRLQLIAWREKDNRNDQGADFNAAFPRSGYEDEWIIPANEFFHASHLWIPWPGLMWELRNDGLVNTARWWIEMKLKAGV